MKSKEVLKLLQVSRVTLMNYVKQGKIKATKMENGFYDYDGNSVYEFLGKNNRVNVIYVRVSTQKQKNDLIRQQEYIQKFCDSNKIKISKIYSEIDLGVSLDRKEFQSLLDDVILGKIRNIYVSYKDRLSRLSYLTIESLFKKFGTTVHVVSDIQHKRGHKTDDAEFFEELISLMHFFSTKTYSHRKNIKYI